MRKKPRLHRLDRLALVYDEEILPIWSQRFGRMILRDLSLPPKASVLDVSCATGYPSLEILQRLGSEGRIIAMDRISTLVDVARQKAGERAGKRIFFRTEAASPRLSFANEVYDLVVCNLGLEEVEDRAALVREFARVVKRGGQVAITLPLAGTWREFYDLYREVLLKYDRRKAMRRLQDVCARHPDPAEATQWMERAGLGPVSLEVEPFVLLFRSAEEFFYASLIEFGPLPIWKAIAGGRAEVQEIFTYLKRAIELYFGRAGVFRVAVVAGCLRGVKRER